MKRDKIALLAQILQISPLSILGIEENKPGEPDLEENMIVYYRNGKTSEIKLPPKKMDLIVQMINEFKDKDPNPDLEFMILYIVTELFIYLAFIGG